MRVSEIKKLNEKQLNQVLLLGAPGIGKTEIVLQYAKTLSQEKNKEFVNLKECDIEKLKEIYENPEKYFIYYRIIATHIFPEDVSIPREQAEYMIFKSPLVLSILQKTEGVLFIDELTNVQRTDQRVLFYSLIQEREIGWNLKLSENIIIVCAGNPPEMSSDASLLPTPLANRLTIVQVDPPTVDEWGEYMNTRFGNSWDKRTFAFLKMMPSDFLRLPDESETLEGFPTPRSWTSLALKINENTPRELLTALAIGNLGNEVAGRFIAFCNTKIPSLQDFLKSPKTIWDNSETQQKYLLTLSVAQNIKQVTQHSNFKKLINDVFSNEREFLVLLFKLLPKEQRLELLSNSIIQNCIDQLAEDLKDFLI